MVCLECCSKLEQSYRFLEASHIAQITLHRLFPIGEENCHNSELKEEECLVELLPLSTTPDQLLIHQVSNVRYVFYKSNLCRNNSDYWKLVWISISRISQKFTEMTEGDYYIGVQ